ncbi:MAG: FG-GAP repeat protein [Chitinophagaceae bacterium]|nr:FG-GAP repeat protein [Chitinophagaceae bacterium]
MNRFKISALIVIAICYCVFMSACTKVQTKKIENNLAGEELSTLNQNIDATGTLLGNSVDIDDLYSIAGDPGLDELLKPNRGAAYVYNRTTTGTVWTQRAILKNANGKANDNFGYVVTINGNYAAATTTDSIYVFKRSLGNFWVQTAAIVPPNLPSGCFCASSLDLYGDILVVGQPSREIGGNIQVGAVYIFKRVNERWNHQKTILSPNNQEGDRFGSSVAIHKNWIIIGSRGHHEASHGGKAYAYLQFVDNWLQQATLIPTDIQYLDNYGGSVDIWGEYVIVGADQETSNGSRKGSAYVFKRTGADWAQQAKLLSPDNLNNANFGRTVAINNSYAIVAADKWENASVYTFKRNGTSWPFFRSDDTPTPSSANFAWKIAMDSTRHYITGNIGSLSFGTNY